MSYKVDFLSFNFFLTVDDQKKKKKPVVDSVDQDQIGQNVFQCLLRFEKAHHQKQI